MLEGACRWKIGDGKNIRVWGDPWLKDEGNFCVVTPLQVDLVDTHVKEWDKDFIEVMFVERGAREICDIFLSSVWSWDCLLWHFSKNGHYSLKSGYRLLVNSLTSNAYMHVPGQWEMIWSAKVQFQN